MQNTTPEKTLLDRVNEYFENTPEEQIQKDWKETLRQTKDVDSPTVEEFIASFNIYQEIYKEAIRLYPGVDRQVDRMIFMNGAKWQQERMYSLEDISKDFIGEEGQSGHFDDWLDYRLDSKDILSFKEWFEQFKKK